MRRAFVLLLPLLLIAGNALAADPAVRLYKAFGTKEDLVFGLTPADFAEMSGDAQPRQPGDVPPRPAAATDADLDLIGDRLVGAGHLKVWLYAPRRGQDGPELAPVRRILLLGAQIHHIEPYATADRVVPPGR